MTPSRVVPPARAPGRLAFVRAFVRNPLEVIPQAAYEEDYVPVGGERVWVTSPAIIKAVLLDERDKFRKLTQIRLLRPLLGKGILTSEGAEWKWQRQASAPMFRPQALGAFVPAFVRAAADTLDRWREKPGIQAVDEDMTRATFEVISATLLPSADSVFAERMHESIRALQSRGGKDLSPAPLRIGCLRSLVLACDELPQLLEHGSRQHPAHHAEPEARQPVDQFLHRRQVYSGCLHCRDDDLSITPKKAKAALLPSASSFSACRRTLCARPKTAISPARAGPHH